MEDNFTKRTLRIKILNTYFMRSWILSSTIPQFTVRLLDKGCGKTPYRSDSMKRASVKELIGLDVGGSIVYDLGSKGH